MGIASGIDYCAKLATEQRRASRPCCQLYITLHIGREKPRASRSLHSKCCASPSRQLVDSCSVSEVTEPRSASADAIYTRMTPTSPTHNS